MATVTIEIPDEFLPQFQQLGDRFPEWLALNLFPSTDPNLSPEVSGLSDDDVMTIANLKLSEVQNDRLSELQQRGKTTSLSELDRYELIALLQIYQLGQLRKSEALAEAVHRGLRSSLSAS
jgi:hypothetical protein